MPDPETNLPAKKISKVKLDPNDSNSVYEIIPERLQKSGFEAALPTLTADTTLVTADGALKSPYALDIKVNNETAAYISYDGSATKTLVFQPGNTAGSIWIGDGTPVVKTLQLGGVFTDSYPSTFTWTNGTTAGPTGSLSGAMGNPFTAVSFGAIPAASASQSGVVTTGDQTFNGAKTFSGSIISEYIYGDGNNGLCLQDSHGDDSSLELTSSCASISGPSVSIAANGSGGIELSTAGNNNISLFSQNYSGTGKAYYKGDEIATVAGTRIEIVDLTTINS